AGDGEVVDGHAGLLEGIDDGAGTEGRGLDEGTVDLAGAGGEGESGQDSGEVVVDQDGAVAALPVEGEESVGAHRVLGGLLCEDVVDGHTVDAGAFVGLGGCVGV